MASPSWIILLTVLAVIQTVKAQSHLYMYSRFSCDDLIPKHAKEIVSLRIAEEDELRKLVSKKKENHVAEPKKAALTKAESAFLDLSARSVLVRRANKRTSNSNAQKATDLSPDLFKQFEPMDGTFTENSLLLAAAVEKAPDGTAKIPNSSSPTPKETKPRAAAQKQSKGETTTRKPTTTTTLPPPANRVRGSSPVTILTGEDKYRRLKHMTITLQSTVFFEGFMLQARQNIGGNKFRVVGRFIEPPRQARVVTCDMGYQQDNTIMDRQRPILVTNLTFSWVGPDSDRGNIEFVASVSTSSGERYYTSTSQPLTLSYFPVSTKDCSRTKSCFRLCPRGHRQCPGYAANYMATFSLTNNNNSLTITIGGYMPNNDSYVALGLTDDGQRFSGADLSVCYMKEGGRSVGLAHYLLEDVDMMPDLHQGNLILERDDSDSDQVWCSFTRPLKGNDLNSLKMESPKYLFYFWGVKNGSDLYIPKSSAMKRSSGRIMITDGYFNEVSYSSAVLERFSSGNIVFVAVTLATMLSHHFLW